MKKGEKEGNDRGWETTFAHRSRENEIETIKEYRKMGGGAPLVFQRFQATGEDFYERSSAEGTSAVSKLVETNVAECWPICILIVPVSASP